MKSQANRISPTEKIGYALGDTASNLMWMFFIYYINYFYTDVFRLRPEHMATMFLIVRIFDSLNDPIVGILADRTETRWGKFKPYILWFAIPFGVIGWLTLTTPDWGYHSKVVYAYITYSVMMVVYTLINIPYSSLLGVISSSPQERTSISGIRFVFAQFGGILVQVLTTYLVVFYGGGTVQEPANEQLGYSMTGLTFGIIASLLFFVTFFTTKERVKPSKEQKTNLKSDIKDLVSNVPWWILFSIGVFTIAFVCIRNGSIMYYFKYYAVSKPLSVFGLSFDVDLASTFMIVGTAVALIANALVGWLARLFGDKKKMFLVFMAATAIFAAISYFIPKHSILTMFVFQIIISFTSGPTGALIWAMYADTADYSEHKNKRRATGLVFSAATASQKLGWTIGGVLTGVLLAVFNYNPDAITTQTGEVMRLLISIMPAIAALLATVAMIFYPLSDKKMALIESDLKELHTK